MVLAWLHREDLEAVSRITARYWRIPEGPVHTSTFASWYSIYAYIHASRRNDWFTRVLPKGSPAGGDLNTTWTMRDTVGPVWTTMVRAEKRDQFEPTLNACEIILLDRASTGQGASLEIAIASYSPYWVRNEYRVDGGPVQEAGTERLRLAFGPGRHSIEAWTVAWGNWRGPVRKVESEIAQAAAHPGSTAPR